MKELLIVASRGRKPERGGYPIFPEMGSRLKRMYQYPDECRKG